MDRRGFLQRLAVVVAGAGLAAVAPAATTEAAPALPPPIAAPTSIADAITRAGDRWSASGSLMPGPGRTVEDVLLGRPLAAPVVRNPYQQRIALRKLLKQMSQTGDDTFRLGPKGEEAEEAWRWAQVRQKVLAGYGGLEPASMIKRLIALPVVGDALFVADEPGYAEWQRIRRSMYAIADKALGA